MQMARSLCDDEADAEDLFQDLWASILARQTPLPSEDRALVWLNGALVHLAQTSKRKKARRDRASQEGPAPHPSAPSSPETKVAVREILKSIAELPPAQRDVATYRLLENRPYSEIADRMGSTESAARKAFSRALDRLRQVHGEAAVPRVRDEAVGDD